MKTTLALGALFILVLGGGYVWNGYSASTYGAPALNPPGEAAGSVSEVSSTSPSTSTAYTTVQVATHAKRSDCWTSINGGVYNLTAWISQHPGGEGPILNICGKDGSAAFNGQHGGNGRAQQALAMFKIGTLTP